MSYGHRKVKTEMKGTGGGRWEGREIAKKRSNKARRVGDKERIDEARARFLAKPANQAVLKELAKR